MGTISFHLDFHPPPNLITFFLLTVGIGAMCVLGISEEELEFGNQLEISLPCYCLQF